jgi:predicted nuclease of predicted toxin-antitoxin system
VTLIFDANLSATLVRSLRDVYPGSSHVSGHAGLQHNDRAIWDHALKGRYAIVSKDSDYAHFSLLYGPPPKVILLAIGNCSTIEIDRLLRRNAGVVRAFLEDETTGLLVLRL